MRSWQVKLCWPRSKAACRWLIVTCTVVSAVAFSTPFFTDSYLNEKELLSQQHHVQRLQWQRRVAVLDEGVLLGHVAMLSGGMPYRSTPIDSTRSVNHAAVNDRYVSAVKLAIATQLKSIVAASRLSTRTLAFSFSEDEPLVNESVDGVRIHVDIVGEVRHASEFLTLASTLRRTISSYPMAIQHCLLTRQSTPQGLAFNCQFAWYVMTLPVRSGVAADVA